MDERNVILEIRAGTGGDEAALFAGDLFRMYERYAAKHGWKVEVMTSSEGSMGGYKEIIAEIQGRGAFAKLKFESGVHRVQRVPDTEASGRIHTSTATVAVLPEARGGRRCRSTMPTSGSTPCARAAPAASTSTRPNPAVRVTHIPVRHRGDDAGGPLAASQPRQGDGRAAHAALRPRAAEAGSRARRRTPRPGRHRRPLRAHPHLQFPARPRHRASHQSHPLQAAADHGGRGAWARSSTRWSPSIRPRSSPPRTPDEIAGRSVSNARTRRRGSRADDCRGAPPWHEASAQRGVDSPELDARVLIGHALGLDQAALAAAGARSSIAEARDAIEALARAAASRASRSRASSAARNSGA